MQPRAVRFGIRGLLILVAIAAVALCIVKLNWPESRSRYRMIEAVHSGVDGSLNSGQHWCLDLDSPVDDFHGTPDGKTRFREIIARLKANKAEYKVTSPRGFRPDGEPIY